jgi:uridine kinase
MVPQVDFIRSYKEVVLPIGIRVFFGIILLKLLLVGLFSSGYQDQLFTPFVRWFVSQQGSPWEAVFSGQLNAEFPYPPLMLYLLAICYSPIYLFNIDNIFINNMIQGIPLVVADVLIVFCIAKLSKIESKRLVVAYLLSPIILFSTFIHHQLDVIPIAFLLLSLCFFIRQYIVVSALLFGCALATKFHILAILPLLIIYLLKQRMFKLIPVFLLVSVSIFTIFSLPYIIDVSYQSLVMFNPKQQLLFDTFYRIGEVNLYLPIFVALLFYMGFLSFKKVNRDLLLAFSALLFTAIIFFIQPSPGWFVWIIPLVTLLVLKSNQRMEGLFLLCAINVTYLFYFLFAHNFDYSPINFLGESVNIPRIDNEVWQGLLFTALQATLLYSAIFVYRFSVKSNEIYKIKKPFIVGVGGDSGAGKTTLQVLMHKLFKDDLLQIEGDGDHKWERGDANWSAFTHLDPKANWLHRQAENLFALKNWQQVKRVDYDHAQGKFTEMYTIDPKNFILISGLHPFYLPISRTSQDLKIYMEPEEVLRRHWKVQRDTVKRGYSVDKIIEQIESRMPDARKYIYPQKPFADLVFSFFPLKPIEILGSDEAVEIGLQIRMEASIHIERLFSELNVKIEWDYSEDLSSQVIKVYEPPIATDFTELASQIVSNLDELTCESEFESGFNGLIQLITLLSISQKMKEAK